MKRLTALILATVMLLALCACSGGRQDSGKVATTDPLTGVKNQRISANDEEYKVKEQYEAAITTKTSEMVAKFLLGQEPLSSFDEFVETLDELGLQELMAVYESSYARVK